MTSTFDSLAELEDLNLEDETRDDIGVAKKAARKNKVDVNNVKILSNWNFKGGVGKTTMTFGLAFAMAHTFKKRILMVDADPQKNLTQLVARFYLNRSNNANSEERRRVIESVLNEKKRGFYFAMKQAMESRTIQAAEIICIPMENVGTVKEQLFPDPKAKTEPTYLNDMLFLLSGSYQTAMIESWLRYGYDFKESDPTAAQMASYPSVFWNLVRKTASEYGCEYVLVDLSPAISLLNTNILFSSDAFILPSLPEWFSIEALRSIPKLLTEGEYWETYQSWKKRYATWVKSRITMIDYYKFPALEHVVQFVGIIVTRYNYKEGFEVNYAPHSQLLRSYFQSLRNAATVLASTTPPALVNSSSSAAPCSSSAAGPAGETPDEILESLPVEMLQKVTELGWNQDNPFEEDTFRLMLTRLPELNKLNLIAQNASIPSPYLPHRLLHKNHGLDRSSRQKLWYYRQSVEKVVQTILEHFFAERIDLPDEQYPQAKKRKSKQMQNSTSNEGEENALVSMSTEGLSTEEEGDEVESLQSYHEEEDDDYDDAEEEGELSHALIVQDDRTTKKSRR